ncbi:hypothetical protein KIW84_033654 [Lathyrus oleraceus]|uniref:AMP-dependent synthetase/ligase domain-containing protein n=1 Tax=Pisum sativum TaxID=3888 RepID=A0A9D5B069_PEA|nr:hypothetical protein KIW84_033654 [Pisum sativum]
MEYVEGNQHEASIDDSKQIKIQKGEPDGGVSCSMLPRRGPVTRDNLHPFRNFLSKPATQPSVVVSSRATTTSTNLTSAPMMNLTTRLHLHNGLGVAADPLRKTERGNLGGARIGIVAKPSGKFVVGILATWFSGGVVVPLTLNYPEAELLYVMNNSDVSTILSTEDHSELMQNIAKPTSSQCNNTSDDLKRVVKKPSTYTYTSGRLQKRSTDGSIRIWDSDKGTCETTLNGHKGAVTAFRYNKAGSLLASGSKDNDVILWDVVGETGLFRLHGHHDQHCMQIIGGHHSEIWTLDVDPAERYLVTGSADKELRFYTIKQDSVDRESINDGGDSFVSNKWEVLTYFVKIGNPSTGSCLRTIDSGYGLCSLILPSNKYGLVGTKDGRLEIIDIGSGTHVEVIEAHGGSMRTIVALPDRLVFVTGSADHEVKFWDYQIKQKPVQATKQLTVSNVKTIRMNNDVLVVAISPDAKYIVVALLDSTACFSMLQFPTNA